MRSSIFHFLISSFMNFVHQVQMFWISLPLDTRQPESYSTQIMPYFSEMSQKTGSGNEKSRWHLAGDIERNTSHPGHLAINRIVTVIKCFSDSQYLIHGQTPDSLSLVLNILGASHFFSNDTRFY